ncbi:MAG TPA: ABC transporter substrate-binding protein [Casimicrobiaceae bacterium]|nr:ABC transporter substrate-binding protein [Casimicrobiaceae bacterium]
MRPLIDGEVRIDGVDPVIMTFTPEEMFFRAFRYAEFDVSELSMSSQVVKVARGENAYVGVPVFPSRAFRHTSIYVRRDRVARPEDLEGRRIGVPEYQLTANVWARALLNDDHGVAPSDVTWVQGGIDEPGRPEKIALALPPSIRVEAAPEGDTLSAMLDRGDLDGFIGPRPPSSRHPDVGWLFADPTAAAKDYFRRTRIYPIMHVLGVRRTLVERHPWLPAALLKAFEASKALAVKRLGDTSATKVTLPFVEEQLKAARELLGDDFWSYGVARNRHVVDAFLRHHHAQGLSSRLVAVDEMFHPSTFEVSQL